MPNTQAGLGAQLNSTYLKQKATRASAAASTIPTTRVVADSISGNFNTGNMGNRFDKARNNRVQSFIEMVDYRNSKQAPMYAYGMNPSLNQNFGSYSISSTPAMR